MCLRVLQSRNGLVGKQHSLGNRHTALQLTLRAPPKSRHAIAFLIWSDP
jgi:urease accessory protein UreE